MFGGGLIFHQQGEDQALLCMRVTTQVATNAWKHGMESLLFITDAMMSCPESANMASRAILFFLVGTMAEIWKKYGGTGKHWG